MTAIIRIEHEIYNDCCAVCLDESDNYKTAQVNGRWSFISGVNHKNELLIDNEKASTFIIKNCRHAVHKKCFNPASVKTCPTCREDWTDESKPRLANSVLASPEERQQNTENIFHFILCCFIAGGAVVGVMIYVLKRIDT